MIEIQIHPSDIRRRVRYFFLDRRRVVVGIVSLTVVLMAIIGSMAAAPTVIRRVYKTNFLHQQRQERDIQRERLRENVVQMSSLERTLEEHGPTQFAFNFRSVFPPDDAFLTAFDWASFRPCPAAQ